MAPAKQETRAGAKAGRKADSHSLACYTPRPNLLGALASRVGRPEARVRRRIGVRVVARILPWVVHLLKCQMSRYFFSELRTDEEYLANV